MESVDRRNFLKQGARALSAVSLPMLLPLDAGPFIPPEPVRVAVFGAGARGREILAELARFERVEVAAVADAEPGRLRRGLRMTRAAKGFGDWRPALAERKDWTAAVVALPTHLHREATVAALESGVAVYCEAPLASTLEDARAIVLAGRKAGRPLAAGHVGRSNPVYKLARSFYRSGSVESLVSMTAWWRRKNSLRVAVQDPGRERALNWQLDDGASLGLLGEATSHQLDTLFWFTDKLPVRAVCEGGLMLHQDGRTQPDSVHGMFRVAGGASLHVDATLANSYENSYELLSGTMGTIKLAGRFGWLFKEADSPIQGWEVYANRQQFHQEQGITLIADATKLASQGKLADGIGLPFPPLHYGLESFLAALSGGEVACTAEDAYATLRATLAGVESLRSGQAIDIEPDSYRAHR